MTAATFTYADETIPTTGRGRPAAPNPHASIVSALTIGGTAKAFTVPTEDAATHVNLLRKAGRERDITVRTKLTDVDPNTTKITFWAAPKQTRARTVDETAASPATEGAPAPDDEDGPIVTADPEQGTPPDTIGSEPDTETPEHAPKVRQRRAA